MCATCVYMCIMFICRYICKINSKNVGCKAKWILYFKKYYQICCNKSNTNLYSHK